MDDKKAIDSRSNPFFFSSLEWRLLSPLSQSHLRLRGESHPGLYLLHTALLSCANRRVSRWPLTCFFGVQPGHLSTRVIPRASGPSASIARLQ